MGPRDVSACRVLLELRHASPPGGNATELARSRAPQDFGYEEFAYLSSKSVVVQILRRTCLLDGVLNLRLEVTAVKSVRHDVVADDHP